MYADERLFGMIDRVVLCSIESRFLSSIFINDWLGQGSVDGS